MNLPRDLDGLRQLAPALRAMLPRQRWFAGAEPPPRVEPVACCWVRQTSPAIALTVWAVTGADGATDRYHLPIGFRPDSQALPAGLEPLVTHDPGGAAPADGWVAYDGLTDPELATGLLRWLDQPGRHPCQGGTSVRRRLAPTGLGPAVSAAPLAGDHTNSGVVFDERVLLKVFRRIWPGINPEVELGAALAAAGFLRLATPLRALELETADGPFTLAAALAYLPHGTDGFSLALTSLRDLFGDLRFEPDGAVPMPEICEAAVSGQGGSFEGDAQRIGVLTGQMHLALSAVPDLGAEPIRAADHARWADEMGARLERLLAPQDPRLEALRPQADAVRQAFTHLRQLRPDGRRIRLHGDYHLGQLLRVDEGWVVLDFEGEPARPIAERRQTRSPLQDVAGMLRSFDYAAAVAVRQQANPDEPRWSSLVPFGRTWAARNRRRFLSSYLDALAGSELLPAAAAIETSLLAFQLGKALYEVDYELAHRPDWAAIPLTDIAHLRSWTEASG